ncbi:hypothetical protein Tco_1367810 [Tanacetum coccineum]
MTESPLVDSGFAIPVFTPGDDPIAYLNKAMAFLTVVAYSRFPSTKNQLRTSSNPRNQANIQYGRVIVQQVQGRQDPRVLDGQAVQTIIPNNAAFQTEDLDTYDSDCDDISNAKAVLMANISNYGSDVISEVPHSETYLNDMENQSVHAMQDFEQTQDVDFTDNEIHIDKQCLEIAKKELLLENDRLLQQIMSQYVLLTMMNSMSLNGNACEYGKKRNGSLELLVYIQDTCPNAIKLSGKKVAVTPKNDVKKVRFAEPLTSSSNIKQVESSTISDSNTPVLSPIGLKCSTSNYRSKPTGNKKNDRISRTPSRNMKNKVEAQPRKVNKKNRVV